MGQGKMRDVSRRAPQMPKFSIQYGNGKGTRRHGQYHNPDVKK